MKPPKPQVSMVTKVIPEEATVYGKLIQSEKIRRYARVKTNFLDLDAVDIKGAEITNECHEP